MKKLGIIGALVALLGTQAMAVENGTYNCIITELKYGELSKKLPESAYQGITFKKQGQYVYDKKDSFLYKFTLKNVDFYANDEFLIGMPGYDVGDKIFPFDFKKVGEKVIYYGYCKKK